MSGSSPSCRGIKLLKAVMRTHMRWCMHIEDDDDFGGKKLVKRSASVIKVAIWEGGVKTYSRPIKVAEVTVEFPKHMLCRSDSLYIGQKIPPLSDDHLLQPGRTYFVLPSHMFLNALSFVSVASILSSGPRAGRKTTASSSSCQPFLLQKSPSGCSRMRVSDDFIIAHLYNEQVEDHKLYDATLCNYNKTLCTTPQLHKDYAQLVKSRLQWKPKLPTITETTRRRNNKLLSSSLPSNNNNNKTKGTHTHSKKIKIFKSRKSSSHSPP